MKLMKYKKKEKKGGQGNTPSVVVFITAVSNTKLCAWGEEDSGGHVL
jgi:hypothetical protein